MVSGLPGSCSWTFNVLSHFHIEHQHFQWQFWFTKVWIHNYVLRSIDFFLCFVVVCVLKPCFCVLFLRLVTCITIFLQDSRMEWFVCVLVLILSAPTLAAADCASRCLKCAQELPRADTSVDSVVRPVHGLPFDTAFF